VSTPWLAVLIKAAAKDATLALANSRAKEEEEHAGSGSGHRPNYTTKMFV
jgi:hypothetical protein